jgi:protein-S-isoprenylcysteine O-methyltransferase Ste14
MMMKQKAVIGLFFLGLLLMAMLEGALIWVFDEVAELPTFDFGGLNTAVGLIAVGVGSFLVIWSVWAQAVIGKGTPAPTAATQKLVITGPYAYIRNPMTLGAAVFYLGISFWHGSLAVFLLVLIVFAALLTYIYVHETRELAGRFGAEYLAYKEKTPFLFPFSLKKKE